MMNWKYGCANFSHKDSAILKLNFKKSIEIKRKTDLTMEIQQGKAYLQGNGWYPVQSIYIFYMIEYRVSEDRE